jgi:hypothetical protein
MIANIRNITAMNPTDRDLDLLRVLTTCTRVLSVGQIAAVWWADCQNANTVRHRLKTLECCGWLEQHSINAHPVIHMKEPLFAWIPGKDDPNADHIAHQATHRMAQPSCTTDVCVASRKAACALGSPAYGLPSLERRDHELHIASVFVQYKTWRQPMADWWIASFALPRTGYRESRPDAMLRKTTGHFVRAIRAVGRCQATQVERFHDYCVEHSLPYELW